MNTRCSYNHGGLCILTMGTCWCEEEVGCPIELEHYQKTHPKLSKYNKK